MKIMCMLLLISKLSMIIFINPIFSNASFMMPKLLPSIISEATMEKMPALLVLNRFFSRLKIATGVGTVRRSAAFIADFSLELGMFN